MTKDRHIRTRQSELIAVLGAGVAAFVLTAADLAGPEMARAFQRAVPRMRRILVGQPRPFVARVSPDGAVAVVVVLRLAEARAELRAEGAPGWESDLECRFSGGQCDNNTIT